MTLDTAIMFAGIAAEAALVVLLLSKRVYRELPLFCSYLIWSLISDPGEYALSRMFPPTALHQNTDLHIYLTAAIIDSIFMFGVLIELSMSLLRPVRSHLPRRIVIGVGVVLLLMCLAIWPFATKSPGFSHFNLESRLLIHLQQTFSALRILFFLAIAGCSQLLAIGWRDRELQIATGFGIYSLASLSVSLFHYSHGLADPAMQAQWHFLDQIASASYSCCILYWVVSFAQAVPERREFTPQMQSFLLAVAGSAHSARADMEERKKTGTHR